jgi:phospholipid/cholesterol/gamma-HCH transport system substrate-binding protein
LAAFAWLVFKFGDLPTIVTKWNSYEIYVQFPAAPGVQVDTAVKYCGYSIGKVTFVNPPKILDELSPSGKKTGKKYHQVLLTLSIDKKFTDIPADSNIKLITRGLGSSFILIKSDKSPEANEPNVPGKFLVGGMYLQGTTASGNDLFPEETMQKIDQFLVSLNTLINNTNDIVGDPNNKKNLADSLANLNKAALQAQLSLKQLDTFLGAGTRNSEDLGKSITHLNAILDKINAGQGTVGRFLNDPKFYESLLENTRQLQILLEEAGKVIEKMKKEGVKLKW